MTATLKNTMSWMKLLLAERLSGNKIVRNPEFRSLFQEDADRVVFCSAFRRLQGKTQVHPFPETDYTHTRLTHSIETSSVGRSLGYRIGCFLQDELQLAIQPEDIAAIVSVACLIHDIGNPPFGHAGEEAIQEWFKLYFAQETNQVGLTHHERADFENFEGNAQGLRTVCCLQGASSQYGLDLTLPVIADIIKYPRLSNTPAEALVHGPNKVERLSGKKFNIYASEQPVLTHLVDRLGLIPAISANIPFYARHHLAFLVEAADDICYNIIDIEDAYKLKQIIPKEAAEKLRSVIAPSILAESEKRFDEEVLTPFRDKEDQWIIHLRAMAIGSLITDAANVFMTNHQAILAGQFDSSLIEQGCFKSEVKAIREFSKKKLYEQRQKLHLELAGFSYIGGLLDRFVPAAVDFYNEARALPSPTLDEAVAIHKKQLNPSTQRLLKLMNFPFKPDEQTQYRHLLNASKYELIQRATDYVSGMTDEFARSMYHTLAGQH